MSDSRLQLVVCTTTDSGTLSSPNIVSDCTARRITGPQAAPLTRGLLGVHDGSLRPRESGMRDDIARMLAP